MRNYLSRKGVVIEYDAYFSAKSFIAKDKNICRRLLLFDSQKQRHYWVEIDAGIFDFVHELNRHGFITTFCCSGLKSDHPNPDKSFVGRPYIGFDLTGIEWSRQIYLREKLIESKYWEVKFVEERGHLYCYQKFKNDNSYAEVKMATDKQKVAFWNRLSRTILGQKFNFA